ncbi:phage portal protein [Bifidobacterium phasiani]|uniref:Phage portal protein n=1 Tax=Bifidobacterium phasiani TaxID=2834431 RepID=A0ABS6WBB6_9BIFI|nr:phage portal protein [Bifidobacterium phasiani]MBW3083801.1 phage portal protein [Bifidobacterium phasiani]
MGIINRIRESFGLVRSAQGDGPSPGVVPPPRPAVTGDPMAMIPVCRGVQIIETAIRSLPLVQRDDEGRRVRMSTIARDPDPGTPRGEMIAQMVADLAFNGNIFMLRQHVGGFEVGARLLPAAEVAVTDMSADPTVRDIRYSWRGVEFGPDQVIHRKFIVLPGMLRGVGPITMARMELQGMAETAEYASNWRTESGAASAVVQVDDYLTDETADAVKQKVMAVRAGTPLVLGKGSSYQRYTLSPEDMQFIQSRNFDTTQVARMLGIPANLLLASVEGSSLTYQNIEQSWIEFSSYTLQAYAMPICDALSQLVPARQHIAMDWNKARRSDTKSRWEALKIAVDMGLMTLDEAREWENMPPAAVSQAAPTNEVEA